jgi:hypothetical protein
MTKRFIPLFLILLIVSLAGCGQHKMPKNEGATPFAKAFNYVSAAQDTYNTAGPILQGLRNVGAISHQDWNAKVVPIDQALDAGFGVADPENGSGIWGALYAWKANQTAENRDKVIAAVDQVLNDLDKYAEITDNQDFRNQVLSIKALLALVEGVI